MTRASSWACSWIRVEASWTSWSVMSELPVTLMSTPLAPWIDMSSRRGLDMAFWAASMARFSPEAMPTPMMAMPFSLMTVFTSAKSTSRGRMI